MKSVLAAETRQPEKNTNTASCANMQNYKPNVPAAKPAPIVKTRLSNARASSYWTGKLWLRQAYKLEQKKASYKRLLCRVLIGGHAG